MIYIEVIAKSKDMRALQGLQEEKEMYEMQLKQLQTMLRSQMEDLEKYKRIATEATNNNTDNSSNTADTGHAKQKELQERIIKLRNDLKEAEIQLQETSTTIDNLHTTIASSTDVDDELKTKLQEAEQAMIRAQGRVTELKGTLQTAEEEAEDSASAAIKATRARERAEREHKEKLNALEQALATATKEAERLSEEKSAAEAAHARDLENLLSKLQEKDIELATFRAESKQAADNASDATAQIEEMRKSRDEAIRLRDAETKSKEEEIKRLTKDKEKEFEKTIKDKEKEYEKNMKDKEKEYQNNIKEKEKEYEKTIKEKDEELKKAVAAAKKAAAAEEFQSEKAEMMKKIDAANLMVAQLTESAATSEAAKLDAIEEAKLAREKLIKREQKLTAVTQEKAEAQAQVQELSADVKSLSKKLEKSKINVRNGEETLRQTKQELEKTQTELRKITENRDKLSQELTRTKEELTQVKGDYERTLASWESVSAESSQRADAISQLEIAITRAQTQIEEQRNEYLIATKLTKQSNKELKTALAAETRKVAKLERDLITARKNVPGTPGFGASNPNAANRGIPSSPALTGSSANNTGSPMRTASNPGLGGTPRTENSSGNFLGVPAATPSSMNAGANNSVRRMNQPGSSNGLTTPPGVPRMNNPNNPQMRQPTSNIRSNNTPSSSGKNLAPMGGGNMEETVKLLGTRLKDVLAEAEVAREKVKMLEGIVQSVSEELADKKRLLKELTSTSGGAVDDSGAMETVRSAGTDPSLLQNLLQKAMSENARLKRDMKVLGKEIMEAQDKARKADELTRKANEEKQQAIEAQIALQSQYNQYTNENYSVNGDINDNGSVTISERGDGTNLYAESPSLLLSTNEEDNTNPDEDTNTIDSNDNRRPVAFSTGSNNGGAGNPFGSNNDSPNTKNITKISESGNPFGAAPSPKKDTNKSANPFG